MTKKFLLWLIFVAILIHFLKDITQDILQISTPLDIFGNVKEDLSGFPQIIKIGFFILGIISFLSEIFLLISIPFVNLYKTGHKLEKFVWLNTCFILVFFISAILLDPRYSIFNLL